ncbi:class I SAM-dependent methyltransferase [Desulfogranum marinum]|uniref:class I SAM-dependent methyltransferase n=1 Tax=Desulfogranum marinum TaxID=453220 RepID=UPI0029C68BD3|nr:class I SAM-dependent methyltransferase [Desulfogranum marinum]
MKSIISDPHKDPLGAMMLDYLHGDYEVFAEVASTRFSMSTMSAKTMFRTYAEMDELEREALHLCRGTVLDVGAGSGCHSLCLQEQNVDVDALDISPGCIKVMEKREVKNPIHNNLFSLESGNYTTILMLMNGLGICGSLDGLNLFLQHVRNLLAEDGQIIADSTDLRLLYNDEDEEDESFDDSDYGETEFIITYDTLVSVPFQWIYVGFPVLQMLAEYNGFECQQIATGQNGHYLARMYRR